MKAIILAGGKGTRLYPLTKVISKQLNSVYDKPMIYYSLSILMLAGIQKILLITTESDKYLFEALLKDGSDYGIQISYAIQKKPRGIGEAFLIGEEFLKGESCAFILGDNFFYGHDLIKILEGAKKILEGAVIFSYYFQNSKEFGVVTLDATNRIISLEEKPKNPASSYIIPGLYFFDSSVVEKAKKIVPSRRGELEMLDILQEYLKEKKLKKVDLDQKIVWFDMGTEDNLLEVANFVKSVQTQQNTMIACLEEIAYRRGWIKQEKLEELIVQYSQSKYAEYLKKLLKK